MKVNILSGWALLASLVVCIVGSQAVVADESQVPISLHPANPHYFLWRGRPTVLITSGEHYGALVNREFDFVAYFEELASHGLNLTRVFSGAYRETATSFGITDNTLAPHADDYVGPWMRTRVPGARDGGAKFDLTQWNDEYFERLRQLMEAASARNIVVEMTLFCPMYNDDIWDISPMNVRNNVNRIGDCDRDSVYSLSNEALLEVQVALTRRLVEVLAPFDNVYFEVCNEPYTRDVPREWEMRIVEEIRGAQRKGAAPHLISLNVANQTATLAQAPPGVSLLNFHYCRPPSAVADNHALNVAIGENETGFRGSADVLYRTEGWDFMMAGGALFNNLDYSFTAGSPEGGFLDYKSPGGGSPARRRQLGILKRFFDDMDFVRMGPDAAVVVRASDRLHARALSAPGETYAVYVSVKIPYKPESTATYETESRRAAVELQLLPGLFRVQWTNTLTGDVEDGGGFHNHSDLAGVRGGHRLAIDANPRL